MDEFAATIQARAASLRKTGNLQKEYQNPSKSSEKPPTPGPATKPKPRPKRKQPIAFSDDSAVPIAESKISQDSLRQRSQTLKHTNTKQTNQTVSSPQLQSPHYPQHYLSPNEAHPYGDSQSTEVRLNKQQPSPLPNSETVPQIDLDEAYDDIDSVKEQMQLYLQKANEVANSPPPLPPMNANVKRPEQKMLSTAHSVPTLFEQKPSHERDNSSTIHSIQNNVSQPIMLNQRGELMSSQSQIMLKRPFISQGTGEKTTGKQFSAPPLPPARASSSSLSPSPSLRSIEAVDLTQETVVPLGPLKKSEPIPLKVFVEKYANELPLQLEVAQGTPGGTTIDKGELYNVHFIKTTQAANLVTSKGMKYTVPLNSAIQFGVLYNPVDRVQDAIQGYLFNTAGEIISTQYMPPLVYAQKSYDVSSPDGCVYAGEVLVIKEVKQTLKQLLRGKCLSCTVVGTEENRKLFDNCEGSFSTAPADVKLHLPDIIRYLTLPQQCVLYYTGLNAQDVLPQLPNGVVTLSGVQSEKSLIITKATPQKDTSSFISSDNLMELPIETDILVHAIWPHDSYMQKLIEDTSKHYRNFSPASLNTTSMLVSENPYHLQKQAVLLSAIRYDESLASGINIKLPPKIASMVQLTTQTEAEFTKPVDNTDDHYQYPDQAIADYEIEKQKLTKNSTDVNRPESPEEHYDVPQVSSAIYIQAKQEEYDIPRITSTKFNKPSSSSSSSDETALTISLEQLVKQIEDLKGENKTLKSSLDVFDKTLREVIKRAG